MKVINATLLTSIQLKMLDIGAPVIVSCKTVTGDLVQVRLQSQNLDIDSEDAESNTSESTLDVGGWEKHGVYIAIMPNGVDYGQ